MINKQYRLTEEGLDQLQEELEQLKQRGVVVAENIATARQQGDLSENAEYQNAKDEQRKLSLRIKEIESILSSVEVIKTKPGSDEVQIGCSVQLTTTDGQELDYMLVGSLEADPLEGKISDESPIGQALLGAKPGQTVELDSPSGSNKFTVKKIY